MDDVFRRCREAYKRIFMQASAVILDERDKKELELKKLLHDTGLAIAGA